MASPSPAVHAVANLLIRFAIGVTFIWSGFGKLVGDVNFAPAEQQTLAAMGTTLVPSEPTETAIEADSYRGRRLFKIAVLVHNAANPTPAAEGEPSPRPYWPDWAARGGTPVLLAWAVAITEAIAGVLLLFGALTRISALVAASTMVAAAWLTQIGPYVSKGDALLGFLPNHQPWHDPALWSAPLWQLLIFCASLALVFTGAGAASLDGALGARYEDEFADDAEEEEDD